MANKRIETQLSIKAVDQYSSVLKGMRTVTGRFADGVRTEMSRLQGMRGSLKLIEDFKDVQSKADRAREAFEEQRREVARLRGEMRKHGQPTEKMVADMEKARQKAKRLRSAYEAQRGKLSAMNGKLREAGIDTSNLGRDQRRLVSRIDGVTTAFGRQIDKLKRIETMQTRIADGRVRMDRALATSANLSFVGNASMQTGRRILTPLSRTADRSGDLEEQFIDFQNLAGIDDGRLAQLREELDGLRDVTKSSVADMLSGLGVLVGKGMDFEEALAALPATARAAKATKTSFDEMGASGFALFDNLKIAPGELRKGFDVLARGGKEGGFELDAMARKLPEITAGARALGMEGMDSLAQLTAALQVSMKSAGSEDQAATNLSNFLGKLTSPETVRRFAKFGVSIEEELQKAAENGVSPFEHMVGVINELTGGDALKMGELFGDKQVLDFLRAMIPNLEEYRRIRDAALSADGVIDEDLSRLLASYNESKAQLGESVGKLLSLPPEVLESLTGVFQKADAIVERMIVWKKENPKLVKTLFLGATALGAMAVAGGALLTAAAGLIGTMAVLRFGLVGLGARAAFAAGDLIGIGGAFRGLMRLPKFALSRLVSGLKWTSALIPGLSALRFRSLATGGKRLLMSGLIKPLQWTSALIPGLSALRFRSLATGGKRLLMSGLIKPLQWTAKLLPNFAPALARFTDFRIAAISEMAKVSSASARHSKLVGASFASSLGKFALKGGAIGTGVAMGLGIKPVENGENSAKDDAWWSLSVAQQQALLEGRPADSPGIAPEKSLRPVARRLETPLSPYVSLRPVSRSDAASVDGVAATLASAAKHPLPTPAHLQELRDYAASLRDEIAGIQGDIDNLGQGPMTDTMAMPLRQTMDARRRELQEVEAELSNAEGRAGELTAALQVLDGTEAAPEISTASIDRANEKVARLLSQLRSVPSAGTGATVTPKPAGARAGGGAVRMGLPYLVNENTPRSEWFVPSRSGGVLNVGQAQAAFRSHLSAVAPRPVGRNPELARLHRGAQGLRAASLAVLTSSALAAPAAAQPAQASKPGSGAVTVQIENFTVHVPSGVSDPDAIAELVSDRIGQRVAATLSASFSD